MSFTHSRLRAEINRVGTTESAKVLGVTISSVSRYANGKHGLPRRINLETALAALALRPDKPRRQYGRRSTIKRDRRAYTVLSEEEHEAIKRVADGRSISSWLRNAALAALRKEGT